MIVLISSDTLTSTAVTRNTILGELLLGIVTPTLLLLLLLLLLLVLVGVDLLTGQRISRWRPSQFSGLRVTEAVSDHNGG